MVELRIRNPLTGKHDVTLCERDEINSEDRRYKNNYRVYYIHVYFIVLSTDYLSHTQIQYAFLHNKSRFN